MTNEIKTNQMMDEELDMITGGNFISDSIKSLIDLIKDKTSKSASTAASASAQTMVTSWI